MTFEEMCLDTRIMRAIAEMGFEQPSPIQAQSIPIAVEGKDMIGQARTGTGKTASFGIPMLQRINPKDKSLQAIVLCPTRELAIQSANEIRKLAKFLHGIKVLPIYGGQEISKQIRSLKGGVQIVIMRMSEEKLQDSGKHRYYKNQLIQSSFRQIHHQPPPVQPWQILSAACEAIA